MAYNVQSVVDAKHGGADLASTTKPRRLPLPLLLAAALLAALAGCATAPTGDAALAQRLIGKWSYVRGADEREQQTIQLDEDGAMRVSGVRHSVRGARNFAFSGRWRVEEGQFHYSGLPFDAAVGSCGSSGQQRERIVAVTDWEWVMIGQCTGKELRAWRYPK